MITADNIILGKIEIPYKASFKMTSTYPNDVVFSLLGSCGCIKLSQNSGVIKPNETKEILFDITQNNPPKQIYIRVDNVTVLTLEVVWS